MAIMKALLTLASVFTLSAVAHAGSINYDFRGDWNSTDYNKDAAKPDYTKFYFKTGRVDFKGNLNDSISYQLRLAYNKDLTPSKRDSAGNGVEYGYITHKMSDLFSLSLGKFNTEIGGFEAATSGADLYTTSAMYTHSSAVGLAGNNESTSGLLYNAGAKAAFSFAEKTHYVAVVATNNIGDSVNAPGTDLNQNRGLLGVIWKGAFMEKALNFLVSYHTVNPQTTSGAVHASKDAHNFIATGVKWDSEPYTATLEYLTASYKDDTAGQTDTLNTVVAKLMYKMGMFTPRLEYTYTEEKIEIGGPAKNKYSGVGAAVEYKPTEDNFRYHLAYAMYTDDLEGATGNKTRQEIVLGARLYGDFLK